MPPFAHSARSPAGRTSSTARGTLMRENGALVELFRTYPGSRVNQHVARFVVWGAHADYLIGTTLAPPLRKWLGP